MVTVVRLIRMALVLVLALLTLSLVMGIGSPSTGWLERVVMLGLIALCVLLAAEVSTVATRVQARLHRH